MAGSTANSVDYRNEPKDTIFLPAVPWHRMTRKEYCHHLRRGIFFLPLGLGGFRYHMSSV